MERASPCPFVCPGRTWGKVLQRAMGSCPAVETMQTFKRCFSCRDVLVKPQFIRLLQFICFMLIKSCFCNFWIYLAQSKTSQLSCVYWEPTVRIKSEDEHKWTQRTGAAVGAWELGLNCHSHAQAQFLLISYLTSLLSTCTVSCHPFHLPWPNSPSNEFLQLSPKPLESQICFTLHFK